MLSLALIGLLGGLITGISPCILPVLPVIFFSGTQGTDDEQSRATAGAVAVKPKREVSRPYRVIGGLVLSFSLVTLVGSALLSLLHLPQDAIRWVALVALVAIGLGLIFPRFEQLLERPFARIPQKQIATRANGFGLGLALGVLYVPCAGPVLAAIVVAGATANIGLPIVVLTVAFAVGTAVPLLFFALAGQRVAERVSAFRRHQRGIRVTAGVVTILLAVALVFNLPAVLQRAIPDYTSSLENKLGDNKQVQQKQLGGIVNDQNKELSNCTNGSAELQNCGPAPDLKGINAWLNTPGDTPIDLQVVAGQGGTDRLLGVLLHQLPARDPARRRLVQGIPGQRVRGHRCAHPRVRVRKGHRQRRKGCRRPRHHLPDRAGQRLLDVDELPQPVLARRVSDRRQRHRAARQVRRRRLRRHREADPRADHNAPNPGLRCPRRWTRPTPPRRAASLPRRTSVWARWSTTPEPAPTTKGQANFTFPPALPDDTFALQGPWTLDYQGATADSDASSIELNYHAKNVYIVVGGTGNLTVTRDGKTTTLPVSGPPTGAPDRRRQRRGPRTHSTCVPAKGCRCFLSPTAKRSTGVCAAANPERAWLRINCVKCE